MLRLGLVRFWLRGNRPALGIFTHMTLDERIFLYGTSLRLPRRSKIAEIGSYLGASACFLAAAARERESEVYCIDTWRNDSMSEGNRDTWGEFERNVARYRTWIKPVRSSSVEAATQVPDGLALLFVDGDHSYEGVVGDLHAWLPKLQDGGWLVMHDWGVYPGVRRAVEELVRPHEASAPVKFPNMYAVRVRRASVSPAVASPANSAAP